MIINEESTWKPINSSYLIFNCHSVIMETACSTDEIPYIGWRNTLTTLIELSPDQAKLMKFLYEHSVCQGTRTVQAVDIQWI